MTKYSGLDPQSRERFSKHISRRWGQLHELEKEWGERALKYLLLTNSGGAIATLGFVGANDKTLNLFGAKLALALFVIGIILVGISNAKTFHHMSGLYEKYKAGVEQFYGDKITWDHLTSQDEGRAKADLLDFIIPYGAFCCFIAGCLAGAYALFT